MEVGTPYVCSAHGGQKRVSDNLGMELQLVVSSCLGIRARSFEKTAFALNCRVIFPASLFTFLWVTTIWKTHVSNANSKFDFYRSREIANYNSASIRSSLNDDLHLCRKKNTDLNLMSMKSSVSLLVVKAYRTDDFWLVVSCRGCNLRRRRETGAGKFA